MKKKEITRAEAKKLGLTRYYTGKSCVHEHIDERLVSDGHCCACTRIKVKAYMKTPKGRVKMFARIRKYNQKSERKTANMAAVTKRRRNPYCKLTTAQVAENFRVITEQARFGNRYLDAYSGKLISTEEKSIDHVVPIVRGGTNSLKNLCITSKYNNDSKGAKSLLVWMTWKKA